MNTETHTVLTTTKVVCCGVRSTGTPTVPNGYTDSTQASTPTVPSGYTDSTQASTPTVPSGYTDSTRAGTPTVPNGYADSTRAGTPTVPSGYADSTQASTLTVPASSCQASNTKHWDDSKKKVKNTKELVNNKTPNESIKELFPRYNNMQCATIKSYWQTVTNTTNSKAEA